MRKSITAVTLLAAMLFVSSAAFAPQAVAASFTTKIFRAGAIGAAVSATAPQLNSFVNTVTIQKLPSGTSTKVVPILSVGEKGYIGAAQVAGPSSYVGRVQAIWAYEDNFSSNEFRLKILVPTASLNPLQLQRVDKVGVTAVIDVALDGRWKGETVSRSIRTGDVIKAGAVALAIGAAADPLNRAINVVTRGSSSSTRVVPIISVGEKAYIGGVQVSGPASVIGSTRAAIMYEAVISTGKYRAKVFVPSNSINPLQFKRVAGVGISAIIDTSIADQEYIQRRKGTWRTVRGNYRPLGSVLSDRFRADLGPAPVRKDNGLHKGWYIGKGNQRKMIQGVWVDRYSALSPANKDAFVIWWNNHYRDDPKSLDKKWFEWRKSREAASKKSVHRSSDSNKGRASASTRKGSVTVKVKTKKK